MAEQLTIGAIWQSKRTGQKFQVVAVKGSKVQIATTNGQAGEYRIMTQKSLRKSYVLVAIKEEPTTAAVAESKKEVVIPANPVTKTVAKPTEGYGAKEKSYQPARIETADGKVMAGIRFLRDIAGIAEADSCKDYAASYWLGTTKKGQEVLSRFGAKIVYGKPLTK